MIDLDSDSAESELRAAYDIPPTYCVSTRQGMHLYFWTPIPLRTMTAWRPGIDIRGEHGLVVAAGSTHVSGYTYRTCPDAVLPAQLPDELLLSLPRAHVQSATTPVPASFSDVEIPGADQVMEAMFMAPVRALNPGSRNADLFRYACRLYEGIWHGLYARHRMDQLARNALHSGLTETEISRTLASARHRIEHENGV